MVAAYLGVEPATHPANAGSIEEAAEFIPVATVSKDEFDELLKQHGLPTGE